MDKPDVDISEEKLEAARGEISFMRKVIDTFESLPYKKNDTCPFGCGRLDYKGIDLKGNKAEYCPRCTRTFSRKDTNKEGLHEAEEQPEPEKRVRPSERIGKILSKEKYQDLSALVGAIVRYLDEEWQEVSREYNQFRMDVSGDRGPE